MAKQILLGAWAAAKFDPPPSTWTLRAMARSGKIDPPPVKVGKNYYVDENAEVRPLAFRLTLVDRLRSGDRKA